MSFIFSSLWIRSIENLGKTISVTNNICIETARRFEPCLCKKDRQFVWSIWISKVHNFITETRFLLAKLFGIALSFKFWLLLAFVLVLGRRGKSSKTFSLVLFSVYSRELLLIGISRYENWCNSSSVASESVLCHQLYRYLLWSTEALDIFYGLPRHFKIRSGEPKYR